MFEFLPPDIAERNIENAIRVCDMIPHVDLQEVKDALITGELGQALCMLDGITLPNPDGLVPSPQIIIKAEILNAMRYFGTARN